MALRMFIHWFGRGGERWTRVRGGGGGGGGKDSPTGVCHSLHHASLVFPSLRLYVKENVSRGILPHKMLFVPGGNHQDYIMLFIILCVDQDIDPKRSQ